MMRAAVMFVIASYVPVLIALSEVGAAVTCPPCPLGYLQNVAIDQDTVNACTSGSDPDATWVEFQVERQPGGIEPVVVATNCQIEIPIFERKRVRTLSRFCNKWGCGPWNEPSFWIGKLESFPICYSDVDGDGDVDGDDFISFRSDFILGCQ